MYMGIIEEFEIMGGDRLEDIEEYWINQFYSFLGSK